MKGLAARFALAAFAFASLAACAEIEDGAPVTTQAVEEAPSRGREPLAPLAAPPRADPGEVALGRKLFFEKRFSSDQKIACASCHDLASGGDDGRSLSVGVGGKKGVINAPTVFNASSSLAFFWDGRAKTLEDQIESPLTNPVEMDSSWAKVIEVVSSDAEYRAAFAAVSPDGVSERAVKKAIATFERSLVTTGSAFDRYLLGDKNAINERAKQGLDIFKSVGCVACHQGAAVGGNMFQRFGVFGDYLKDRGAIKSADFGRFNVTGREDDRFVFRVPSLRNVDQTSPYFHDGSAATLDQAVEIMASYQLGRTLASDDVRKIVAFLETLSAPEPSATR